MNTGHENEGVLLLTISWVLNIMSTIDRHEITFFLGTIATIMAIVHYWVKIKNDLKKK